jgi:prepilin-type N-terminal cleavage/methylation domain-containing protein
MTKQQKHKKIASQAGVSLVELLVVVFVAAIILSIAVARLNSSSDDVGGAERLLDEAAAKISARKSDAVRLDGEDKRRGLQRVATDPLPIDFSSLETTGSLRIDGPDADKDCYDDVTGKSLTCLIEAHGRGVWQPALNPDALVLPSEWHVLTNAGEANINLVGGGSRGRGVLATEIGFDGSGRAYARNSGSGEWVGMPLGAESGAEPSEEGAPFWAVYFVQFKKGSAEKKGGVVSSDVNAAVAIAIHPSGLIERFRYDGNEWIGYKNRSLK